MTRAGPRLAPGWLLLGCGACVPGGISVPAPSVERTFQSAVVVERDGREDAPRIRAERVALEPGTLPSRRLRADSESLWMLYEESLEALELSPGAAAAQEGGWLAPRRIERLEDAELGWQSLRAEDLPAWARPFQHPYACPPRRQHGGFRPLPLEQTESPMDGRRPAFTSMIVLDESQVLLGSGTGRFYRVRWPRGGEPELDPVETATANYSWSALRVGDELYLGGTGARFVRAPVPPLLEDPPRLVWSEERRLAERPATIDHAIVSISGDPSGAPDVFFMTESTEVFHLGRDGVRALGRMEGTTRPFDPTVDRALRARQIAWVSPSRGLVAWAHEDDPSEATGPVELHADGTRTRHPLPRPPGAARVSATSVAFHPELGAFVAQSYTEQLASRAEVYWRPLGARAWERFARLDVMVRDMVPDQSAVFVVGDALAFAGGGHLAPRGFDYAAAEDDQRCLWFRPNGPQRLAASFGAGRWLSTGSSVPDDPPWLFMLER